MPRFLRAIISASAIVLITMHLNAGKGASITVYAELLDPQGLILDANGARPQVSFERMKQMTGLDYKYNLNVKEASYNPRNNTVSATCIVTAEPEKGRPVTLEKKVSFSTPEYSAPLEEHHHHEASPWNNIRLHIISRYNTETKHVSD